jgi:hypothetical protein
MVFAYFIRYKGIGEMHKLNCWEIKKCGRQPGGNKVKKLGVCPAASDTSSNGINGGKNAGRICWAIVGTFCGGKVQGTFAKKQASCMGCEVFNQVKSEEGTNNIILLKDGQVYKVAAR